MANILQVVGWLVAVASSASSMMMIRIEDQRLPMSTQDCVSDYASKLDSLMPGLGDNIRSHPLQKKVTSNRSLILGAGPGTTGTRSLNTALKLIGLKSHHCDDFKEVVYAFRGQGWKSPTNETLTKEEVGACLKTVRNYDYTKHLQESIDAELDTPVAENFLNMFLSFPNSKVILTKRPGLEWVKSRKSHNGPLWPMQEPCGLMLVGRPHNATDSDLASLLSLHNEFIRCLVPANRLMEINLWTESDARMRGLMQELANFVGAPLSGNLVFPGSTLKMVSGPNGDDRGGQVCPSAELIQTHDYMDTELFPLIKRVESAGCELHSI
eukprot:TRINITY_DN8036_c0_g1_i1.p1 TRINITY_DN8036_c0_g1~~TRINITY_DN8036_c0_g1_i1.p1  ORF type:complete len:358 (-),score=21.11 TRINITY_DN8036_c0_g1_i1:134-1108(-)